jgi:hypothetical protein
MCKLGLKEEIGGLYQNTKFTTGKDFLDLLVGGAE